MERGREGVGKDGGKGGGREDLKDRGKEGKDEVKGVEKGRMDSRNKRNWRERKDRK